LFKLNCKHCETAQPYNFDKIETEMVENEKAILISLLKQHFTGEMRIRLIELTKTVQMRLSPS